MKANHIAVMALEEFPPNHEFVGRNFNAGEVIQLVLKAPRTGQWLSFRSVQMVMMHELAHCKQMNHSKFFWQVRDRYADELRGLWDKGYSGEGLWGKGQSLETGRWMKDTNPEAASEVHSLCGGTYRSQRGKRKRKAGQKEKPKVSYAERQQRRILKKFGTGGVALGENEDTRSKLEAGKKAAKGKPKVAGSNRGRELRAAAALARLQQSKTEPVKEEPLSDSETESDYEDEDIKGEAALDLDGQQMLDSHGHGLVKVCGDDDTHDDNVKREMDELKQISIVDYIHRRPGAGPSKSRNTIKVEDDDLDVREIPERTSSSATSSRPRSLNKKENTNKASLHQSKDIHNPKTTASASERVGPTEAPISCPVCSFANEKGVLTCAICAHVMNPEGMPNAWKCNSTTCRGSSYLNAGDCGVCGICGGTRQANG